MSLIAWYPLNGDTKDYSGNAYNLTNNGATSNASGKIGSCYEFTSNVPMNYVGWMFPKGDILKDFTASAWIYPTETPTQHGYNIISFGGNSMIRFRLTTDNSLWVLWGGDGSDYCNFVSDNKISLNTWTHVTYRLRNGIMSLYINGKLDKSYNKEKYIKINLNTFYVGGYTLSNEQEAWRGKLNDVRIYDEALSAKQIKEIAQAKICHYTFNEELYENTVNLYNNKNQIGSNGPKIEWENTYAFKFEIQENTTYAGAVFNSNLTLKPLTTYTLSYKLKKIEGSLTQIRGHVEGSYFDLLSTKLNGKENYYHYHNGIELNDSFDTHYIEVTFRTKEDVISMNKIYIQPNAKKNEYVKVRVWDVQVEEKDHATPFTTSSRSQVLKDISGYGYDMTTYNQYSPVWNKDDSNNRIKNYSTLTKKDSYFNLNFKYKYPDAFTFSCWVRTTDNQAFCLVGFPSGNNTLVSLAINNNGKISLHSYLSTPDTNADKWYASSTTAINDGEWHFVAVTYNGTTVKSYIDGKYEASSTVTFDFKRQAISDLTINMISPNSNWGDYETRRYEGDISDVRVYATALSAEDIKLLYQPEISIDKANVIRCSEINEEKIENKNGFNKDASIIYNEFNEIPNIESGIHNLRLGNEILPVLIDMDNDGGRWARVFYHNCKSGTVLFSKDSSFAEAKETNIDAPTTSDKYSILSKLESFRPNTNSSFEFRLKYPTDTNGSNIWKQTSNPTHQKVTGYKSIKIDWTHNYWGGLEYSGNTSTLIDGSANHNSWYYAIGAANKYGDGIPNNNGSTANDVELWVRINNYDLFVDSFIDNVSISRNGILTAKEFREI